MPNSDLRDATHESKCQMKLKTTLRRHPWRRRKVIPSPHDLGYSRDAGHLVAARLHGFSHANAIPPKIDPAVYNELVTPKDPDIGMETPDLGQILYTTRPYVVVCPSSDEDDDDEFGEVRQVPISLYYDAYGDVIEDDVWAHLGSSAGRDVFYDDDSDDDDEDYGARAGGGARDRRGDEGERDKRYRREGEFSGMSEKEKEAFREAMEYYWLEKDVMEFSDSEGRLAEKMNKAVNNSEETLLGRSDSERPLPARGGGGRGMWPPAGRSLSSEHPHGSSHESQVTLDDTTCFIDPQDMIWASMCAMYPSVAWNSVGVRGGAADGAGVEAAKNHQSASTCVAARAPRTPAVPYAYTASARRRSRVRNEQRPYAPKNTSDDLKVWTRKSRRSECEVTSESMPSMPSMDQLFVRRGRNEGREPSPQPQHGPTAAGATLPGHPTPHTPLTRIDYDNLAPDWHKHMSWEELRRPSTFNGVDGLMGQVPHASESSLATDSSGHPHIRHHLTEGVRRSSVGVVGRRGEGAWRGGPRGQASVTCGALGQAGPGPPVSTRALPRAHTRSRTTRSNSVTGDSSVNSETDRVSKTRNTRSGSVTSVQVSLGDGESWPSLRDGVCDGECTCAMPCKVSGIPVYQGRGGDPPRNPREDVPPAAPTGGASGRGRGNGRRAGSNNKPSPSSSNRSPAFMGRRGSFGAPGTSRGSVTQEREVDLPRRASLPGPGVGAPVHCSTSDDSLKTGSASGLSSHRARSSPSPIPRSPARGASPGLGARAPSPVGPGRTPTSTRRRESLGDTRTPPATPLARRPPPRAVYQVRISPGASGRDTASAHKEKSSSKLPVMSSKSGKADPPQTSHRSFPPRPASGRAATASLRGGKETPRDKASNEESNRGAGQLGHSSLKLDTPPKALSLSLSVSSPESPETKDSTNGGGDTSLNLSSVSGTAVTDSDATPDRHREPPSRVPPARTGSVSMLPKSSSYGEKLSGLARSGNNRLTASSSRLSPVRRGSTDAAKSSETRLDHTLSASSSNINTKPAVTRTFSGPKSSLVSNDGASRARIVRRVMSGSRTNLSKKKSNSKTSLVVGRHNMYNRSKSGSKNSLLGSRNNLFRASLDSQRTESTTDSGCNSPLYGSQCSLDGERKRHNSSPSQNLHKTAGSFNSRQSKFDTRMNRRVIKKKEIGSSSNRVTPTSPPRGTPDPVPAVSPEPDQKTTITKPAPVEKDMGAEKDVYKPVSEREQCKADPVHEVKIVHTHSMSSSQLVDRMEKPPVSVRRSYSLQLPRARPAPLPKPTTCELRSKDDTRIRTNEDSVEDEGKENRPLPGINVSFRSVSSRPPDHSSSQRIHSGNNEAETVTRDKKEITKVAIVAEPKTREEKGIQVEASSSEEEEDEDDEEDEEEEDKYDLDEEAEREGVRESRGEAGSQPGKDEVMPATKPQVGYEGLRNLQRPLPGPLSEKEERSRQSTADKVRKNTVVHISGEPEDNKLRVTEKKECPSEYEENRNNEKVILNEDDNNHLIQRLETSLADIIDSAVLKNLKINGNILTDQFDAIIATLKKVAASVDSGESEALPLSHRNSECGVKGPPKTPVSPLTPLTPTSISSSSSSSMSPMCPSTPRTPTSKAPLSLLSINECYPGQMTTPPALPRSRKLSLPRDTLQDHSPTLAELARRLHANPNHLKADQDYVDFMDLDQPYVTPPPTGPSTSDLIRGDPTPKSFGRKNSTGSLGLSSCASLLEDNSYYNGGPTTTASVTNLNSSEDYANVFGSQQSAFRKVHSTSNVNGSASGGSHRLFQRHLSFGGPDDMHTDNRLRKSLSKSRELLSQLENEYKKIKGDENKSARNSLVIDQSWLDKDFDELLQTLSNDKTIQSDPHEALAFLTNNNNNNANATSSSVTSSVRNDKWKASKKDMPPLPSADSPRTKRQHGQAGSEGRHIFSFFQKKGRSQSLSGTEAIKIVLPVTPEDGPQGGHQDRAAYWPQGVHHHEGTAPGSRRVTYESATLDRPGRSNRSNSIPSGAPQASAGNALPLDLVGILRKGRSKSLSKAASKEGQPEDYVVENGEEGGGEDSQLGEGEDEPAKQMRSLSLPKSFLSDKYGLTGFKAALPSVIFPWRRGEQSRSSGRSSPAPYDAGGHSPASSPYASQCPSGALHEEAHNGPYDGAPDPRQKEGVWRRSRGPGVSRNTRREKASSSPVFRRASLSHSEWDIRRPWSHVYSEREAAKLSQSVCRLAMTSAEDGGPVEGVAEGEEGPRSLPYMSSSAQASPEGMFQKFKKSLSLRLAKKGSRSESPGPGPGSQSAPVGPVPAEPAQPAHLDSQTLPRRRGSVSREDDTKSSFLFGHPLFRSSKERRRARLKDARSSKCNSGDSGDSGIELVTGPGPVTALDMTSHGPDVDSNNYVDPAFVASLADDGSSGLREVNPRAVRRTHSDVGGAGGRGSLHYSRQLSTPQPIKIRPAHRLPQHTASLNRSKSLKRSKGSSHLRRSISQPLDLDKAYDTPVSTLRKCRSPTNTPRRRQRRPSAGNILNEDNTTSEDEIGMSDSEDFRTDLKRSLEEDDDMIIYAEALWDHVTLDCEELVFKAGDLITVIDSSDKDWWWGRISHRAGWFPAAFVRLLVNQEEHQDTSGHQDTSARGPARKLSISGLSHDQIRTNVINEIISTERDFVKHLRDVVEGYLRQVRKRPDMFTDERVSTIFGNMEALYHFQSNFLRELEMCIDWQEPFKSCIGATFIRNREKFEIYSEYCNNHPSAVSSLQELYQDQKYVHFFEACRLLQEMIDISLDGFLLTPVQKICKYPLQLQELLKYTKPDHPDYTSVQGALEAMRDVALLVNERKRRMECLEKIASWQITVEGWEGPELLEDSSQLIYQGEVTKGVGGSWPKEVTLFLFDHQLVYCKRDLLKRNTFVYRGRLNLDNCEIVDLPDGKDSSLNINVHNGWKIHSFEKNKWYVFSCKTTAEKQKWMEAFKRERELVAEDESAGFVVADKAKHLAKVAARNQKNRPKRPRSLWFSFGGHKKGRGSGRTLSQIQHHPV
ncbi:uncharacterized protein LOC134779415 isoform X2 [Penaeus indicus]|uniref:uncharacterized protein LOC134779415 isoform X2 n=1 Tax=Penaeus indicus TaxID=29960 RepID=UPI00300D82A2